MARVFPNRQVKRFKAGIVPHLSHKTQPAIRSLCSRNPKELKFIDIQRSPQEVVTDIDKCDVILSTSLHGLVFADSLGIPCTWITLDENLLPKDMFKYRDYNSALERTQEPVHISGFEKLGTLLAQASAPNPSILEKVQGGLDSAFTRFKQDVEKLKG
jgi:pyruvyltransferase